MGNAHCILLGASSAGTETLKNLVLPGIGKITIVDSGKVCEQDLGNNFFVTIEDVGKNKAQVLLENLLELNPEDVTGEAINKDVDQFLNENGS